jgi:hypothetical protein
MWFKNRFKKVITRTSVKTKTEKSTRLTFTGFHGKLEHLKIKTRLIHEMFSSVMGEYVFSGSDVPKLGRVCNCVCTCVPV